MLAYATSFLRAAAGTDSIVNWYDAHAATLVTSLIIVVAAVVLNLVSRHLIRRIVERVVKLSEMRREQAGRKFFGAVPTPSLPPEPATRLRSLTIESERYEQRCRTVGSLLRYVTTIVIYTVAILMVLSELGVNIAPLIAGAGIAGVALGFGAQSLVKDFLSGIFMLLEDQYGVGDVVDVGEASGTIENVTLRVTTLRDVHGTVWYVPNGEIRRVGNKSQLWSRIVLDLEVAYDTDIAKASKVIKHVADEEWKTQRPGATILEEPELWGVEQIAASAIVLRLAVKTKPGEQWVVGRALRARLKEAFDEAGIVIPFPQQTVWVQGPDAGAATQDAGGGVVAQDAAEPPDDVTS